MFGFHRVGAVRPPLSENLVPSPREVLQMFPSVVVTGGSSDIGKSFIELTEKLEPGPGFCNLCRGAPVIKVGELKLCQIECDFSRSHEMKWAVSAGKTRLTRGVPTGALLLINTSSFGSHGRFPEANLGHRDKLLAAGFPAVMRRPQVQR